jgi:ribosomal protein S12 methylthiotransferase
MDSICTEAETLVADGAIELNLIAQDLTAYGRDRTDGASLSQLLRALAKIDGLRWIRLLYTFPRYVTEELLDTIADEEKVCSYIDMPLQHISDRILQRMRRERDGAAIRRLLQRMRHRIPDVAVRTAFIVGFPGEADAEFTELLQFVQDARFERVGVFRYSREDGTAAAMFDEQVPESIKRKRRAVLMRAQAAVSAEANRRLVGSQQTVLVCGQDDHGRTYGRLATQAPEIDGVVHIRGDAATGAMTNVRITGASTYDLRAEAVAAGGDGATYTGRHTPIDTA